MSSAAAHHPRKRRTHGAHDNDSLTRQHRRRFLAVRSFGLRFALALATAPHYGHKRRLGAARHPVSTPSPRRHRRRNSVLPVHFPAVRPFVLRHVLSTGASAPFRRRKASVIDMGNYVSRLLRKSTSDGGLGVYRGWVEGSQSTSDGGLGVYRGGVKGSQEVGVLNAANNVEGDEANALRRGIGDASEAALEVAASPPPEKRAPYYKEAYKGTKRCDGRLEEIEFEVRLHEGKLAKLRKVPADRPEEDLSGLFTPLTNEEESEVNNILYGSVYSKKVIVMHEPSNIEITKEKLWCLRPGGWLNDEIINLYLELLKERAGRDPKRFLKCHFFNTFYYKKLACGKTGYDYQSVRRWTTLKKLGYGLVECDKIFVPVHRDIHWCLAIINMKDRTFQYLDSLGGMDRAVLRILARYIADELKDKTDIETDTNSWLEVSESLPLQHNGWDCGMFVLKFIDFHSRGLGLSFSQEHMEYFRKRTAKEILRLRAD